MFGMYLVEGRIVEIVSKLQIYVLSMFWVFRVIEIVRGQKDALHEIFRDPFKGHD